MMVHYHHQSPGNGRRKEGGGRGGGTEGGGLTRLKGVLSSPISHRRKRGGREERGNKT